jgi:hypothetical protein
MNTMTQTNPNGTQAQTETKPQPAPTAAGLGPNTLAALDETAFRLALEPSNPDQAWTDAQKIAMAKVCGCIDPADAYARIMTGRALGWGVMTSMRNIDIIEGQPAIRAKGKVGLLLSRRDIIEYIEPVIDPATVMTKATWRAKRVGRPEIVVSFTIEMAEAAGLLDRGKDEEKKKKSNWTRFRPQMLNARASSMLCDMVAPDLTGGMVTYEEMVDERARREATDEVLDRAAQQQQSATQAAPLRDHFAEARALEAKILAAKSADEVKAARVELEAWSKEVIGSVSEPVKRLYNQTHGQRRGQAAPPPAPPPQQAPAPEPREPGVD